MNLEARKPGNTLGNVFMRCLVTLLLLSGMLCLGAWASDSEQSAQVKVEKTANRDKDWLVEFFKGSVLSLSIDGTGAHFQMRRDGAKFCLGDPKRHEMEFKFQFTLSKPGEVFYSPDKHGMRTFTVKRITTDSLVLDYGTSFDHRSFGKNLITEDTGQIELHPFTNP